MRLFVAIEIPDNIRAIIEKWSGYIAAQSGWLVRDLRFVRTENLHVTVRFLGEVSEQRLPLLCDALSTLRCEGPPLALWPHAIECFPKRGPVTTVTLSLAGETERLILFHAALERACERLGFPSERRAFVPHITIARARPPLRSRAREEFRSVTPPRSANSQFMVDQFVLMQSHLKPGGPEYIRLAAFPLTGTGVA